jgi:hypothetical protein
MLGARNPELDTKNLLGTNAGKELWGQCAGCKTSRRFAIAPLARKFGKLTHIAQLSYRMRCQVCGHKGVKLTLIDWDQTDPEDAIPY